MAGIVTTHVPSSISVSTLYTRHLFCVSYYHTSINIYYHTNTYYYYLLLLLLPFLPPYSGGKHPACLRLRLRLCLL